MTNRPARRHRPLRFVVLGVLLGVASCTGPASTEVTVLAASSLTDALTDVAAAFEDGHPGVDVALSFAGSSTLATQVSSGAPGDVFAAADERTMDRLVDAGAVSGSPVLFATNRPAIVVAPGNPARVVGPGDLLRTDLTVSLCAPELPCGVLAASLFEAAGFPVPAASREADVRAVLARVELGEADAGVVYVTDALQASGRVDEVPLGDVAAPVTSYPAAVLAGSANPAAAADFVAFLTSSAAGAILAGYGFGPP